MIFARMSYVREAGMNIPKNKQREHAHRKIGLLIAAERFSKINQNHRHSAGGFDSFSALEFLKIR